MVYSVRLIPCLKTQATPKEFFNYKPEFWFESTV